MDKEDGASRTVANCPGVVRLYATICQIFLFGATIGGNNFSVECGDAESVTRFYEQSSSQYESTVANFGDVCAHLPGLDVS